MIEPHRFDHVGYCSSPIIQTSSLAGAGPFRRGTRRRRHVDVDHAGAPGPHDPHRLFHCANQIGPRLHRSDPLQALRLRELGDVGLGIGDALADPSVSRIAATILGNGFLVHLVIKVGAVVVVGKLK